MQFLEPDQIEEWCADHGIPEDAAHASSIMSRLFGQAAEPRGQEREVAIAAIRELGNWDECLLWVKEWGIWPSSEDWPKYYAERAKHSERRSLDKAPGHLFARSEEAALESFLQLVLENAWETECFPVSRGRFTGRSISASHDEYLEVLAHSASQSA
jgi:hypothetical protein